MLQMNPGRGRIEGRHQAADKAFKDSWSSLIATKRYEKDLRDREDLLKLDLSLLT